ncbi:hypothetical protein PhCBS80983_g00768 [Powellomyces hirtus]|uniref:non-specific serine/threonine protein kinase n=1 Tax=Powellomyces hirtus TaxID=109895 RepID=A0A507EDM0_9FUNG|nr:hypothetical protein PhCBS80983_g00768 [Powellomyces hirtus]
MLPTKSKTIRTYGKRSHRVVNRSAWTEAEDIFQRVSDKEHSVGPAQPAVRASRRGQNWSAHAPKGPLGGEGNKTNSIWQPGGSTFDIESDELNSSGSENSDKENVRTSSLSAVGCRVTAEKGEKGAQASTPGPVALKELELHSISTPVPTFSPLSYKRKSGRHPSPFLVDENGCELSPIPQAGVAALRPTLDVPDFEGSLIAATISEMLETMEKLNMSVDAGIGHIPTSDISQPTSEGLSRSNGDLYRQNLQDVKDYAKGAHASTFETEPLHPPVPNAKSSSPLLHMESICSSSDASTLRGHKTIDLTGMSQSLEQEVMASYSKESVSPHTTVIGTTSSQSTTRDTLNGLEEAALLQLGGDHHTLLINEASESHMLNGSEVYTVHSSLEAQAIDPFKSANHPETISMTLASPEADAKGSIPEPDLKQNLKRGLNDLLQFTPYGDAISFDEFFEKSTVMEKIGEASYSSVFSMTYADCPSTPAALKIIPFSLEGSAENGASEVMDVVDVVKELRVTERVGRMVGFVKLLGVGVCHGPWPQWLIDVWDGWPEASENTHPVDMPADQLYALVVLPNRGKDLEHSAPFTIQQCKSMIQQLVMSIAFAEEDMEFEHRDLHWGNVLVRSVDAGETSGHVIATVQGQQCEVAHEGVKVCIIDYTWGRIRKGEDLTYIPLEDPSLFTGIGNGKRGGDLQFDIYRWMKAETNGEWEGFFPKTNIFWIHYLIDKLLSRRMAPIPRSTSKKDRAAIMSQRKLMEELSERTLQYKSCSEMLRMEMLTAGNWLSLPVCGETSIKNLEDGLAKMGL